MINTVSIKTTMANLIFLFIVGMKLLDLDHPGEGFSREKLKSKFRVTKSASKHIVCIRHLSTWMHAQVSGTNISTPILAAVLLSKSISSVSVRTPSLCSFFSTFSRFSLANFSVVDFTTFDSEGFGDRILDIRETLDD